MKNKWIRMALGLMIGALAHSANAADEASSASLPRIALIGDSITGNYSRFVIPMMEGKADVHYLRGAASRGGVRVRDDVRSMDIMLGDGPWAIIQFNWGLWDMCYRKPQVVGEGRLTATVAKYESNMATIVEYMKDHAAKHGYEPILVFATTTPVPAGAKGRVEGGEKEYNAAAVKVMEEAGVLVNDLHAHAAKRPELQQTANVHYGQEGYTYLAEKVVSFLTPLLPAQD